MLPDNSITPAADPSPSNTAAHRPSPPVRIRPTPDVDQVVDRAHGLTRMWLW